jgi:hypothetical protein
MIKLKEALKVLGRVLPVVATLLTAAALLFTGIQIRDSHREESARFALQFDDRMNKPELVAIIDAAYTDPAPKILISNGGKTTDDQLEELLGDYDTLYYLHQDDLVSDKLLYDVFCSDIEAVNGNAEVRQYIKDDRKGSANDADDYIGFDRLAATCSTWNRNGRGHALAK